LAACSSVAHHVAPVPPTSPPVAPSTLEVRVLVFIVIRMDMWRLFATGRKLRRLRLAVLHRVLVVLVLKDLRGVLLVQVLKDLRGVRLIQRHRRCSCYFVALWPLHRQELLVL
jgi:hypothetical protein